MYVSFALEKIDDKLDASPSGGLLDSLVRTERWCPFLLS